MEITFSNPFYLWALLVIPLIILMHFLSLNYSRNRAVKFSNFVAISRVSGQVGVTSNYSILFIRIFTFASIVLAIAGTTLFYTGTGTTADYVLAIDVSSSMLSEDFQPNRLEAAKIAATEFVDEVPLYSQVAAVSFAGTTYINQPLTYDKNTANTNIEAIQTIESGGTDIGNAIVTGTNLLLNSRRPRVIILLTDGRSNIGLSVGRAIEYANQNNVMVNTIAVGTESGYFVDLQQGLSISGVDTTELNLIAGMTQGTFYQPLGEYDLTNIYKTILESEKTKATLDLTLLLMILTLFLLSLEWVLINTRFKIVP